MTDFEKEQAALKERYYYEPTLGDKLVRFQLEMSGLMARLMVASPDNPKIKSDKAKLPF